jgi:hypothetical protein
MPASVEKIEIFAKSVRKYCKWVEKAPSNEEDEVNLVIKLLADLYSKALQLPEIKVSKDIKASVISDHEMKKVYRRFKGLPFNYYSQIFDPLKVPSEEPVVGDLADDLSDIYRDLKKGLFLYDHGDEREAAWEWQLHFRIHWGQHVVAALYALHCCSVETYFDNL